MRDKDVKTLETVVLALAKYLPAGKSHIYADFFETYRYLIKKWEKQKESYQDNAERHREVSRQWRKDNKQKSREYQRQYNQKKKEGCPINDEGADTEG